MVWNKWMIFTGWSKAGFISVLLYQARERAVISVPDIRSGHLNIFPNFLILSIEFIALLMSDRCYATGLHVQSFVVVVVRIGSLSYSVWPWTPWSHSVAHTDLRLVILLLQPVEITSCTTRTGWNFCSYSCSKDKVSPWPHHHPWVFHPIINPMYTGDICCSDCYDTTVTLSPPLRWPFLGHSHFQFLFVKVQVQIQHCSLHHFSP